MDEKEKHSHQLCCCCCWFCCCFITHTADRGVVVWKVLEIVGTALKGFCCALLCCVQFPERVFSHLDFEPGCCGCWWSCKSFRLVWKTTWWPGICSIYSFTVSSRNCVFNNYIFSHSRMICNYPQQFPTVISIIVTMLKQHAHLMSD